METATVPAPSPKRYRVGIWFFSFLLTLLLLWLGNFALKDIASIEPFEEIDQALQDEEAALQAQLQQLQRDLEDARARRAALEASTSGSQRTLQQLLDIRRVDAQEASDAAAQQAFQEAQSVFLENQRQQQAVEQQITDLETLRREAQRALEPVAKEAQDARNEIWKRHRLVLAGAQFLFLIPFVLVGVYLLKRYRKSNYVPLVYAFNAAALVLLIQVIHWHFPSEVFKYIGIALAIAVVLGILGYIIRQLARPDMKWLLQRRKESYRAAECPACQYPILAENMRAVAPDKRLGRKMAQEVQGNTRPVNCPACGTRLFHQCAACGGLRHSLLPYCLHCGAGLEQEEATAK